MKQEAIVIGEKLKMQKKWNKKMYVMMKNNKIIEEQIVSGLEFLKQMNITSAAFVAAVIFLGAVAATMEIV